MKRMFGPDDAMPLVSPSSRSARSRDGRPENCPNHIVSLLRTPLSGGIPLDQSSCRCTRFILSVSCLQRLGCQGKIFLARMTGWVLGGINLKSSCADLIRASTSLLRALEGVDGRAKPGQDEVSRPISSLIRPQF